MSDNENNLPEIPFGNRGDANVMASKALQQWAERYYAKLVEEKQAEEEPSMLDQLLDKVGEYYAVSDPPNMHVRATRYAI